MCKVDLCLYICCPCLLCIPSSKNDAVKANATKEEPLLSPLEQKQQQQQLSKSVAVNNVTFSNQEMLDYENLEHIARVRQIRVTIRKGTQAGIAAGLSVTAGTILMGPVGAVAGGAIGTAMASQIAKDVVSLYEILESTPVQKRHEVLSTFNEAFREEFMETILESPELKLIFGGQSIFSVVRYMVDRDLIESERLKTLDWILESKII